MSAPNHREEVAAAERVRDAAREANEELRQRAGDLFELPLVVLTEQRDRLLGVVEALRGALSREKAALVAEQDAFIAYLMAEHEQKIAALDDDLAEARGRLAREEALRPLRAEASAAGGESGAEPRGEGLDAQIGMLQAQLESAFRDADDAHTDAARLQQELDDAVAAVNDARYRAYEDVEHAKDELFEVQRHLEETERRLEDTRDESREEALRLAEEVASLKTQLDERRDEVNRLRERLSAQGEHQTMPPPSQDDEAREIEAARAEARLLRKQLIDAKRELLRYREADEARLRQREARVRSDPTPSRPGSIPDAD